MAAIKKTGGGFSGGIADIGVGAIALTSETRFLEETGFLGVGNNSDRLRHKIAL